MKLVGYLRVSTDDKGQDPDRQRDVIEAWCHNNGHTLVGCVKDEGTSGAVPIMERRKIRDAVRRAKEMDADGLVVESVDRFTRLGNDAEVQGRVWLQLEHGLNLHYADLPEGMPPFMQEMLRSTYATMGKMFREQLRKRIQQGSKRAAAAGWPNGKPGPKPKKPMSVDEWAIFDQMRADGRGFRAIAMAISDYRGAFNVYEPSERKRRTVSEGWVRKQALHRVATTNNSTRRADTLRVATRTKEHDETEGSR